VVGDALSNHDRSTWEKYLEVDDLEPVDREGGATAAETQFIGYLVILAM